MWVSWLEDEVRIFPSSSLSWLRSQTSHGPEQTLHDTDDPLFPPACHLLLIYAA